MNSARTSSLTALAVVVISMGSCNIIGPIAYMATPEPTIDAEYLLDDRPTVVFVDERSNVLGGMAMSVVMYLRFVVYQGRQE